MDTVTYALLKSKVDAVNEKVNDLSEGFDYKGSVSSVENLPESPTAGDLYTISGEHPARYVYDGTNWVNLDADMVDVQADVSELKNAANDLALNKAPVIIDTASGAIATFPDGSDGLPLRSLVASIEPVQDLHGYDSPWPAGGGKNLFPLIDGSYETTTRNYTVVGGVVSVIAKQALSSSTMLNAEAISALAGTNTLKAGTYTFSYEFVSGVASQSVKLSLSDGTTVDNGSSFTIAEDVTITDVTTTSNQWAANTTRTFKLQIESGTSVTAWSPYENLCPISGWTGMNGQRTGVNLLPKGTSESKNGLTFTANDDGSITVTGDNATGTNYYEIATVNLKGGQAYSLSGCPSGGGQGKFGIAISVNNSYVANDFGSGAIYTATADETASIRIRYWYGQSASGTYYPQLELGSTASAYEPFTGDSISVSWQDTAGTVYGGAMTVNEDGSGELVVEYAEVDLDTLTWSYAPNSPLNMRSSGAIQNIDVPPTPYVTPNALCPILPVKSYNELALSVDGITVVFATSERAGEIWCHTSTFTDAASFKTALTGAQFVYELATPQTYHFDNLEQLSTVYGINNIWVDTGDVTAEYRADTKLYLEKLTAPTEDDMIADHAIASGTFFMVGNTLYKSLTAIANGATITPGTNATQLSLADALNLLNT